MHEVAGHHPSEPGLPAGRPFKVKAAAGLAVLIYVMLPALGVVVELLAPGFVEPQGRPLAWHELLMMGLTAFVMAAVIHLFWNGRNWARWFFLAWFGVWVAVDVWRIAALAVSYAPLVVLVIEAGLAWLFFALAGIPVALLFVEPSSTWFRKSREAGRGVDTSSTQEPRHAGT